MQRFSYGGVTKSWSPSPKQCNPIGKLSWPQLSATNNRNGDESREQTHQQCFNIFAHKGSIWWIGKRPNENLPSLPLYFVGYSHGALVSRLPESSKRYVWDWCIKSGREPYYSPISFKFLCIFSSPADSSGFVVVLALDSACCEASSFCTLRAGGEFTRIRKDSTLVHPYASNKQILQFTSAIMSEGKFYALSLQGTLVLVDDADSQLRITALSRSRAVPSVHWRHFRGYLVESDGEILLVFLISRKSINDVDDVGVFRLQFPRLSWVKMKGLGDRAVFVWDDIVFSCRRNCIYFTQQTVDGWWVFDMVSGCILPQLG